MGTLRKILTTGMGAALMTEGTLRNAISDINVTKQATGYIARQAQKGKEEFARVIASELKRFLGHIDIHEEIRKALAGLTIEVEAKIHLSATHPPRARKLSIRSFKKRS